MSREPGDEPEYPEQMPLEEPPPVAGDPANAVTLAPQPTPKLGGKFADMWAKGLPLIRSLIPKHMTPETVFSIAVTARARNNKLVQCTDISILRAVIQASQLGLDISGVGGMAYMVPYFNKYTKQFEAQMQTGYKGLIDLARRGGRVVAIEAREVYMGEDFTFDLGTNPHLSHKPKLGDENPGEIVGAYAIAVFPNGYRQFEIMSKFQIDKVRMMSKAQDDGPWVTAYPMMARKTVIRRLCNTLPQDRDVAKAMDIEDRAEAGENQELDYELEGLGGTLPQPEAPTRTEAVKEEVKKRRGRPPKAKED